MIGTRFPARGMTLVEVLVAGAMGALLLMSLAGLTGNVYESYDEGMGEIRRSRETAASLDLLFQSIRNAVDATLPNANTLVLEDLSGNITTYAWSGTIGDPLTVQYDAGAMNTLVEDVRTAVFQINNKNVDQSTTSSYSENLIYFDNYTFPEYWEIVWLYTDTTCGIEFWVPKEENLEAIKLTQVRVRLGRRVDQHGDLRISLVDTLAAHTPRIYGNTLVYQDYSNSSLPFLENYGGGSYGMYWATFDLSEDFTIYPNRHYGLVFTSLGPGSACIFRLRQMAFGYGSGPDNGIRPMIKWDGASPWYPDLGSSIMDLDDIPFDLDGECVYTEDQSVSVKSSVDVTLAVIRGGETLSITRREALQGGIR